MIGKSRIFTLIIIGALTMNALTLAGETSCTKCSMKFNEAGKKFSVIMPKVPSMEGSSFDDIGCAVVWRNGECAIRQTTFDSNAFTFDYLSGEQVALENAFFVVETGVKTPMSYDIIAFKDKPAAEKQVKTSCKGKIYKLFELVDLPLK